MSIAMNVSRTREPLHLLGIRLPVYAGLAVLAVGPIAPGAGLAAAVVGVIAGLLAGRELAVSRLRGPVIAALGLGLVGLGMVADHVVAGPAWVTALLGYRAALIVGEILTFGLIAAGLVAGGRALAARTPFCGTLEVAGVAALVVGAFAGHRDAHLSRPQFLSDWALSEGYDPIVVLGVIGLVGAFATVLLMLRPQTARRSAASVVTLSAIALLLLLFVQKMIPEQRDTVPPKQDAVSNVSPPPPKANDSSGGGQPPPKPVAIVNLLDDLSPGIPKLYFRQNAESRLDGVHLASDASRDADIPNEFPQARVEYPAVPVANNLVAEINQRISWLIDLRDPFGLVRPSAIEPKPVADEKAFVRTYHVTSRVLVVPLSRLATNRAGDPSWPAAVRDYYLTMPADGRYQTLAKKIVSGSIDDARLKPEYQGSAAFRALALMQWIEQNTTYTKYPDPSPDATAAFLFDKKPGKCTEVAHSLVFMLRSLGIPARAASGYFAPTSRLGTGSSLLLQESDGHQWCEMYLEGAGWVAVDASPKETISPPDPTPDAVTQAYYGEKNRETEASVVDKMKAEDVAGVALLALATSGLGGGVVLLTITLFLVKFWRRLAPLCVSDRKVGRVGYRAVLDLLSEVGLSRQFGETRMEFADRVAQVVPEFVAVTAAFERRAATGEESLDREAWLDFRRKIAERFPQGRRMKAVLNPLAWMSTR